jgi:hypothetical protein
MGRFIRAREQARSDAAERQRRERRITPPRGQTYHGGPSPIAHKPHCRAIDVHLVSRQVGGASPHTVKQALRVDIIDAMNAMGGARGSVNSNQLAVRLSLRGVESRLTPVEEIGERQDEKRQVSHRNHLEIAGKGR